MALSKRDIERIVWRGVFIFILALILWMVSTCDRDKQVDEGAIPDRHLRVGVDLNPGDFSIDEGGKITGRQKVLVDLLMAGDSVEWVPFTDRSDAIAALRKGEIEVYATSYPYADSRNLEGVVGTEWVYQDNFSLLMNKAHEDVWEEAFAQLAGSVEVYVSENEPSTQVILNNLRELSYPGMHVVVSEMTPEQLCVKLVNGEVDYVMTDRSLVHAVAEADSSLMYIDRLSFEMQQVWLVGEDRLDLKQQLDSAIIANRGVKR